MNEKNKPYKKIRNGRFQISMFKCSKVLRSGGDTTSELIVENTRVCVQYSRYNRRSGDWERQSIWCSPDELRDLGNALDGLAEEPQVMA